VQEAKVTPEGMTLVCSFLVKVGGTFVGSRRTSRLIMVTCGFPASFPLFWAGPTWQGFQFGGQHADSPQYNTLHVAGDLVTVRSQYFCPMIFG
jgi:hypothetical protein